MFRLREGFRMSLWFVPAAGVVAAAVLAAALVALDRWIPEGRAPSLLFGGGAESARNLLSVIAGSMVTSISLIFSVTMVVLQLASAQYSPRVLRSFIRDRLVQAVLAIYIATFVYCLLVLPTVRSAQGEQEEFVPALAVTAALALALASLALFVRYVHHIAHAIRAVTIINTVACETREALEQMYPEKIGDEADRDVEPPRGPPTAVIAWQGSPGVLVAVDEGALLEAAATAGAVVEIRRMVGEFLPGGAPMFDVYGQVADPTVLTECVTVGDERTLHQDAAYGFRQIVDIAERALSPGVNDPTTAVQAIDQLHDLLRRLVKRHFPSRLRVDQSGQLRIVAPRLEWDDYVGLAFDEIRHYSGRSIQVARRLTGAVDDLLTVAPPARRSALEEQRELLARASDREFLDFADKQGANEGTLIS
jgi:uncharacterized membrane protein